MGWSGECSSSGMFPPRFIPDKTFSNLSWAAEKPKAFAILRLKLWTAASPVSRALFSLRPVFSEPLDCVRVARVQKNGLSGGPLAGHQHP